MPQDEAFRERVERIAGLVETLEAAADPAIRASARDLVASVMELHASSLERVLEIVSRSGEVSSGILESLARDPLVSSILVLHGLHPADLETRVRQALEGVAGAEIVSIEQDTVRVKAKHGAEAAIREVLSGAAPDLVNVIVDDPASAGFVPISVLENGHSEASS